MYNLSVTELQNNIFKLDLDSTGLLFLNVFLVLCVAWYGSKFNLFFFFQEAKDIHEKMVKKGIGGNNRFLDFFLTVTVFGFIWKKFWEGG